MQKSYYAIIPANVRYDKDLPPNAKLLYGEITALCNEKGYCWAGNSYFSDLYKVTPRTIREWITSLEVKGYIERTVIRNESKEVEKRIIRLSVGENLPTPEEKNFLPLGKKSPNPGEEKFLYNNTSFNNTNNNDYPPEFEEFWSCYPRQVDKKKAFKSFKTILKNHPIESIVNGTKKYAQSVQKTEKKYIKHPATFLNNESFVDGFEESSEQPLQPQPQEKRESVLSGMWGDES